MSNAITRKVTFDVATRLRLSCLMHEALSFLFFSLLSFLFFFSSFFSFLSLFLSQSPKNTDLLAHAVPLPKVPGTYLGSVSTLDALRKTPNVKLSSPLPRELRQTLPPMVGRKRGEALSPPLDYLLYTQVETSYLQGASPAINFLGGRSPLPFSAAHSRRNTVSCLENSAQPETQIREFPYCGSSLGALEERLPEQ